MYERFEELENRILRAAELVKTTQRELAGARTRMAQMERELEELRRERDQVKNRIELLLESLSDLAEEQSVRSEALSNRR